jgi:hypothetical protein
MQGKRPTPGDYPAPYAGHDGTCATLKAVCACSMDCTNAKASLRGSCRGSVADLRYRPS